MNSYLNDCQQNLQMPYVGNITNILQNKIPLLNNDTHITKQLIEKIHTFINQYDTDRVTLGRIEIVNKIEFIFTDFLKSLDFKLTIKQNIPNKNNYLKPKIDNVNRDSKKKSIGDSKKKSNKPKNIIKCTCGITLQQVNHKQHLTTRSHKLFISNNMDTNNMDTNNMDTNNMDTNNVDTNNVDTNNVDTNN